MRLTSFHVKKYRSIEDSGVIPVDDKITTFVGINESGKTNVMRALRKLNNKNDIKFKKLTENPIWHFKNWDPEEIFITAQFILDEDEKAEISKLDSEYSDLAEISFSRNKKMDLICHFGEREEIAIPFAPFHERYLVPIQSLVGAIDPTTIDDGINQKNSIMKLLEDIYTDLEENLNIRKPEIFTQIKEMTEQLKLCLGNIAPKHDNSKIIKLIDKIDKDITKDKRGNIKNYLIEKLPRFIYFENIGVINSRINLESLVSDIKSGDLTESEITAKTLLDMSGLDASELLTLSSVEGKNESMIRDDKDTASQLCNQASLSLTNDLNGIWSQNEHTLEIEVNGNHLRVWVINKQDNVRLQLEERSRGYQWYFSFYIVFNVESKGRYKDSILLLDEPALFLHATGQKDFLKKALPQLSEKNQIIYTTHSPFLLDLTRPFSIHTVTLDKDAPKRESHISKEHWASDRDALFPLQSAVGYHLAQSMFIGIKNMIVEGLTDFYILGAASDLFEDNEKISLAKNFVFSPAGGGTKTVILAKTYVAQELQVGVLLDADNEGHIAKEQLIKDTLLRDNKILLLNNIFGKPEQTMSLEDIFPEEYYLRFVTVAYEKELKEKTIKLESSNPMLVKRIESFFKKNNLGTFDKTKPSLLITKEFAKGDFDKIPKELVDNFEKLFVAINDVMK